MSLRRWVDGIAERDWQTTDEGTVRFALIGLGWWTVDVVLPAVADSELCEITTLVSSSEEKAQDVANEHDVSHAISYDDFHDGKAGEAYDAVYIGTPNAYHLEYAETAAAHGAAVLCEKPIEANAERATKMVEACEDVPFMAAYRMQTDPLVRRTKELVDAGMIGTPRYVSGTNEQPLLEMIPDPDQWRLDPELAGYGTSVMDLGIYVLNTARFILERDPVEAYARMGSADEAFAEVPDQWAAFSLLLEDDIPLVGTTSQDAQSGSSLTITGNEGRIGIEPAYSGDIALTISRDDVEVEISSEAIDHEREMLEEFEYFADRVITGRPIYPDGSHALVDMETIAAIHEAAETGEPIRL